MAAAEVDVAAAEVSLKVNRVAEALLKARGNGATDTAILDVVVSPVNDAPVATDDSEVSVTVNTDSSTISVLANDSDVDGDTLIVTSATAVNGMVAINADNTITYTPNADYLGSDTITYAISDSNGGTDTATVAINVVNNLNPTANNDTAITTAEDTAFDNINVLANDTDPENGNLSVQSATAINGAVVVNVDGTLKYTPDANFNGTDTITYTVSDGNGGTDTATVGVTVNDVVDKNFEIYTSSDESKHLANTDIKFFNKDAQNNRVDMNKDKVLDQGGFMLNEVVAFDDIGLGAGAYNFDVGLSDAVVLLKDIGGVVGIPALGDFVKGK